MVEVDKHKVMVKEYSKIEFDYNTIGKQYDDAIGVYTDSLTLVGYKDPEIVAQACANSKLPSEAKIIDFGCG